MMWWKYLAIKLGVLCPHAILRGRCKNCEYIKDHCIHCSHWHNSGLACCICKDASRVGTEMFW